MKQRTSSTGRAFSPRVWGRVPAWVAAAITATVITAASAGVQPWLHAMSGAFRPPDFSQDLAAAELLSNGVLPYSEAFRGAHARIYGTEARHAYPHLPHPPFAVAMVLPLTGMSLSTAAGLWFVISIALLLVLAILLAETWTGCRLSQGDTGPPVSVALTVFSLLLLWPPVLYHLEKGQFSLILAVLIAIAGRSLARDRTTEAGVCVGLAAAVKVFPVLLLGFLAVRARSAFLPALLTGALLTGVPLLMMGPDGLTAWLSHSARNLEYWQTWPSITFGVHGLLARALVGGRWAVPFVHAPDAARAAFLLLSAGLVTIAVLLSRPARTIDVRDALSIWSILLVLLNPLSMPHNAVLLALPLMNTLVRISDASGTWMRVGWSLALILSSIPRQALSGLVPLPASPAAGLLITSLPCWATVVLLAVSCKVADQTAAQARPPL